MATTAETIPTTTARKKTTLTTKATTDPSSTHQPDSRPMPGNDQPPKKSVTMSAEAVTMFMYSLMRKAANFIEEYSTWYPATSSVSASARSNGRRVVSAKTAGGETTNPRNGGR